MKTLLVVGGIAITLVSVVLAVGIYKRVIGFPESYELPPGYKGWLLIEFENPSCPRLAWRWGFRVIHLGPGGRACTSSRSPLGWHYERYEYVGPDGARTRLRSSGWETDREVWPITCGPDGRRCTTFIGTREELSHSGSRMPRE